MRSLPQYLILALLASFFPNPSTSLASDISTSKPLLSPPIVYTIAGSDSGGGAGIQADLKAIHSMGCHGCSAITCLTAQSSLGVSKNGIHAPPPSFLREQLDVLKSDLYPRAVKIGMLGTTELTMEVGRFLKQLKDSSEDHKEPPLVVLDPVMISTSGSKLITDGAMEAMIQHVFPYADILTPNKFEVEALLGRQLNTPQDIEQGAKDILQMGVKSVLIKGGHTLQEKASSSKDNDSDEICDVNEYAQDYFLSTKDVNNVDRLCDGSLGVWIRSLRFDTIHTHGTGCTLSSAIASALAIGHQQREMAGKGSTGANAAIYDVDACVLGKAYISAGIASATQLGEGPGPVAHTEFPSSSQYFPSIVQSSTSASAVPFLPITSFLSKSSTTTTKSILGPILPIVDTVQWVQRLADIEGITDIQIRIKDETNPDKIKLIVQEAQAACAKTGKRLWVNDHWEAAINAKCFGVHLGQEDLTKCVNKGGLEAMKEANMALGISTHSFAELAVALAVKPSYISLGPVFGTVSKNVAFDPQGLETVTKWRNLIGEDIPLVAIGGIGDANTVKLVKDAGADCIAVIGAITKAENVELAASNLIQAMS